MAMAGIKKAVNVTSTYNSRRLWSRQSMLVWVNQCLKGSFFKVDHLGTGAAYCCLMDILFPDSINMRRVKFVTELENDFRNNFAILQQAFTKYGVDKVIPVNQLIKGKFQDNYDFIIWFRLFYNANFQKLPEGYDVEKRRYGQQFIMGAAPRWRRSRTSLTMDSDKCAAKESPNFLDPNRRICAAYRGGANSQN
ncbi:hypothetical protein KR093_010620 [Drosophila rubida]|uniref:Calponin-homology (CH) domain-containing protein n=1 Tax=Drosophila rubida TaxID=30044 RepID=A0AAD4K672_9MUSC|nr:hypothetical protein KR093_010620 [Drosophila rubida]